MAKKKKKKAHPGSKSRVRAGAKGAQGGGAAPKDLDDFGVGEAPAESDPKGRAEYFLSMLDAFAQQGTQEAKRIRSALIGAIAKYSEATEGDGITPDQRANAETSLKATLFGMEAGVMELLIKSVGKMRDKILEQARTLGTKSPAGKNAHQAADGMNQVVEALQTMLAAANQGNEKLRDKANEMMGKARDVFAGLGG